MSFSYYIASRLAFQGKRTFSKTIVRLAIAGISISVAVMILSIGILVGFKSEILKKVTGFGMHIQVKTIEMNESYESAPVKSDAAYLPALKKLEQVSGVFPFINKPCILKTEDQVEGLILKGVDKNYDFTFLEQHLKEGKILAFDDSTASAGIILSTHFAGKLKLKVGDAVNLYFIGEKSRVRQLVISGFYETSLEDYDHSFAIVDLKLLQKLNAWQRNEVQGFEVQLKSLDHLDSTTIAIEELIDINQKALNVKELKPQIFDWLALLDTNVGIIIILMIIVSTINMVTALLILILERTNMIGMLKALGTSNSKVKSIFLYQAAYIIVLGTVIGNALAIGFYYLQNATGFVTLDAKKYYLEKVPVQIEWFHLLMVNAGSFVICFITMLLPVMLIVKISPIKALKFD